jgi:hypothetical protein
MRVAMVIFVVAVTMTVVFMLVKACVVANLAILVPMMVVVKTAARTVPIASVKAAAFMAGSDPTSASVGRTAPITFVPAVVSGDGIPIAADPHEIRCRLRRHDDNGARRRRRPDLNANRNLRFCGNGCQQERRKRGSFQQISHKVFVSSNSVAGLRTSQGRLFSDVAASRQVQPC